MKQTFISHLAFFILFSAHLYFMVVIIFLHHSSFKEAATKAQDKTYNCIQVKKIACNRCDLKFLKKFDLKTHVQSFVKILPSLPVFGNY